MRPLVAASRRAARGGHSAGDAALRRVGEAPRCPARFGGDEFVALPPRQARALAERIRRRLRAHSDDAAATTVSSGVADLTAAESPKALFEAADRAL